MVGAGPARHDHAWAVRGLGFFTCQRKASKFQESWSVGGTGSLVLWPVLEEKCGEVSREKEPSLQSSKEGPPPPHRLFSSFHE